MFLAARERKLCVSLRKSSSQVDQADAAPAAAPAEGEAAAAAAPVEEEDPAPSPPPPVPTITEAQFYSELIGQFASILLV